MSINVSERVKELLNEGFLAIKLCDIEEDGRVCKEHYTLEKTTDPKDPECSLNIIYSLHSEEAIELLNRYYNPVIIHGL